MTRQGIIEVAMAILRDEGVKKVTMRRIAAALDTGPAALYVYVRDTEDLHAQLLDALLGHVSAAAVGDGTWRHRLKALIASYAGVLFDHPDMARMALSTQPSGPNYLALVDTILALLREGGVPDRGAAWGIDLLLLCATAFGVERSNRHASASRTADEASALATAIATADSGRYPNVARLGADILSGPGPNRFDWALDVLLNGLLDTPRPPPLATR